jgi:3-octaprenyl-4-hydroxybenzoate carboxy-lyase
VVRGNQRPRKIFLHQRDPVTALERLEKTAGGFVPKSCRQFLRVLFPAAAILFKSYDLGVMGSIRMRMRQSLVQETLGVSKIGARINFKHVFVVGDDVDIFDEVEALWYMCTRFHGDQGLAVIPYALGNQLTRNTYDIAETSA